MYQFIIKILISSLIIAGVSELSKRNPLVGAFIASWPIISILTLCWLYFETRSNDAIILLSKDLFWLTFPGIAVFFFLPLLLRYGWHFTGALLVSLLATAGIYGVVLMIKQYYS